MGPNTRTATWPLWRSASDWSAGLPWAGRTGTVAGEGSDTSPGTGIDSRV